MLSKVEMKNTHNFELGAILRGFETQKKEHQLRGGSRGKRYFSQVEACPLRYEPGISVEPSWTTTSSISHRVRLHLPFVPGRRFGLEVSRVDASVCRRGVTRSASSESSESTEGPWRKRSRRRGEDLRVRVYRPGSRFESSRRSQQGQST